MSTNEPKTLHGVQISVEDWQRLNVFSTANPDVLPTTFYNEETYQILSVQHHDDQSTFGERTPMPSPPLTPKPKGKAKEEEPKLDSRADDIYEEEKPPGLSRPKLIITTSPKKQGKEQDDLAIGMAGLSNAKTRTERTSSEASDYGGSASSHMPQISPRFVECECHYHPLDRETTYWAYDLDPNFQTTLHNGCRPCQRPHHP